MKDQVSVDMWILDGRTERMHAGNQTLVSSVLFPSNVLHHNVIQRLIPNADAGDEPVTPDALGRNAVQLGAPAATAESSVSAAATQHQIRSRLACPAPPFVRFANRNGDYVAV